MVVTATRSPGSVFGTDEVVLEILTYLDQWALPGMTSKAFQRAWVKLAGVRLRNHLNGTGLPLDRVSRVFRDVPMPTLEALFHAMRDSTIRGQQPQQAQPGTGRPPYQPPIEDYRRVDSRPCRLVYHSISAMPVYKGKSFDELRHEDYRFGNRGRPPPVNSFDGLVFILSLVVDGKDRVFRLLDKPTFVDCFELRLVFHDSEHPIPTQRLSTSCDHRFVKSGKGAAQLFVDDDVVKDELIMKIAAFDRKTNWVAHDVYRGAVMARTIFREWSDDTRYGFSFERNETGCYGEKWPHGGRCYGEKWARGRLYFDGADVLPQDILPREDDDFWEQYETRLRQWQVPIGTNFTTLELTFKNVDDIDHLKSILNWRPLRMPSRTLPHPTTLS